MQYYQLTKLWFAVIVSCFYISYIDGIHDRHIHYNINKWTAHDHGNTSSDITEGNCTMDMFKGDTNNNAYWACLTQLALQRNWFPDPINGLFSYQTWNGFDGFWQNGAVLEPMVNYMNYTNSTRYLSVIRNSWRGLESLLLGYAPYPSFDDMAWFGMSYTRIYEQLGDVDFLNTAMDIYNWTWTTGWDHTGNCSGGFYWDNTFASKQTITNVEMLVLGARLFRLKGGNDTVLWSRLIETWKFIEVNNLINSSTFLIADGIFDNNCSSNYAYKPTYNNGVLIGGLVELWRIINNDDLLELAHKVANATMVLKSNNSILTEWCDFTGCDDDALMYKGLFVRNLRYLMDVSNSTKREFYNNWLQRNIDGILANNTCRKPLVDCKIVYRDGSPFNDATGPVFGTNWHGPYNFSAPMQQTGVLEIFLSATVPGVQCMGQGCSYDPPVPPAKHLTCDDKPCPPGEPCCKYNGAYTCCDTTQKCINSVCT
ncbi:unnamed protein product [Owenia fusiformis]|uniref:Mannan endo-1,6-alpha-mannosidase n=1 Tax=Owenia fusiformis TaxID=6347 RepID=A0A8S4PIB5_OWEFU|nr:unnamed protein product [Owenia fusiformis]